MDVRNGIEVRLSSGLTPAEADEVRALVAASPAGSYLQQPDWPELCPPPPRHRYVGLRAYLGQELIPGRRKNDTLAHPLEQGHTQLCFQRLDLPADGALREAQFIGSLGEAAMPGRAFERLQQGGIGDLRSGKMHSGLAPSQYQKS